MRKLFFLIGLSLTFMTTLQAKTIHWLTFIDTTDGVGTQEGGVGEADKNTRRILYSRWIDIVNASLKDEGYEINPIDMYDGEATPENCRGIVEALDCDSTDIIVFYYVGHGTENTATSRFPLMWLEKGTQDRLVPLSWVHNTLKNKGARLTITIGMCCNARQGALGRVAPSFNKNYGKAYVDESISENIKKMFLDYNGDLIVASASPNESSWGCYSTLGETDFFTMHFVNEFMDVMSGKKEADWLGMLTTVKNNVYNDVKNCANIQSREPGATQTPIWENNLTSKNRPPKTKPVKPKNSNGNKEKSEYINALNKAFAYITSSNVEPAKRISLANDIKQYFEQDLIVKVIPQDGSKVMERVQIDKYLGRISTNRMFQNVSVADLTITDGRVSSLFVREVLKSKVK